MVLHTEVIDCETEFASFVSSGIICLLLQLIITTTASQASQKQARMPWMQELSASIVLVFDPYLTFNHKID